MFTFSAIFSRDMVSAAFDAAIEADAANGRVSSQFSQALASSYGLELPAAPRAAIGYINAFAGADKAPSVGKGPGSRVGARDVAQALHALGEALHASGAIKNLPALAKLAPWCNPEVLAEKAAERAAAKAEKPSVTKDTAPEARDTGALLAEVLALIGAGALTPSQRDTLRAALDGAAVWAPETKATKATKATA